MAQAPATVFVMSAQDIRRAGAISLPAALRLAPNLEVARMNGYTTTARGFNSPESSNKPDKGSAITILMPRAEDDMSGTA